MIARILTFFLISAFLISFRNFNISNSTSTFHHYLSDSRHNGTAPNITISPIRFTPPFHTSGRYILDSNSHRFKLSSVNWYGASDRFFIPGGLNIRHRNAISKTIRSLGFNSVRLPYSDEMVVKNPIISADLVTANPDLAGMPALDVFAAVVTSLTDAGVAVIVNNHITSARWCCDANMCDTLWSNSYLGPICRMKQTENEWIEHWETVMRPHIHNPWVIGGDLRNEVRSLLNSWIWSSWAAAAERASERLLAMQPNWLMFIEGTSSANDISPVRRRPIHLSVSNRVVYSAHVYSWSGWGSLSPYRSRKYASFEKAMWRNWGYLLENDIAPVWIGEFGAPGMPQYGDLNYWVNLMKYLEQVDVDFAYWAINPRKPEHNEEEAYSILKDDWRTVKWDYRMSDMIKLIPEANRTI